MCSVSMAGGWLILANTGVAREYFLFKDSLEDGSAIKASEFEGLAHTEYFNTETHSNKIKWRNDLVRASECVWCCGVIPP